MRVDVVRRHASGGRLRADCAPDAKSYAWPDASPYFPPDSGSNAAAGSAADTYAYFAAYACAQHASNTTNAPADACTDNASADAIL